MVITGLPDLPDGAVGCHIGDRFYTRAQYEAFRQGKPIIAINNSGQIKICIPCGALNARADSICRRCASNFFKGADEP